MAEQDKKDLPEELPAPLLQREIISLWDFW